jgi:biopolymer transport protein ExbB/TolQ
MHTLLVLSGPIIYFLQAFMAVFGVYMAILLSRKIGQKKFKTAAAAGEFMDEVKANLDQRDFDSLASLCDSPPYWAKATPQMILIALAHRDRGFSKLRDLLGEKFDRDIMAELQYQHSWIGTVAKTAPMLGLLGTVTGMILAFEKISTASAAGGLDPGTLAQEIAIALNTTAIGLTVAIPMTVIGSWVQLQIAKMADNVQEQLGEFLHDLQRAMVS